MTDAGLTYPSLVPYLLVPDAPSVIAFLEQAFGAVTRVAVPGDESKIKHAELTLGDGVLMISDAMDPAYAAHLCHYVADVDAAYEKALTAGGVSVTPPADMEYGHRMAGIKDPAGNVWWIGTVLT